MISGKLKNIICSNRIKRHLRKEAFSSNRNSGKIGLIIDAENFQSKRGLTDLYKLIGIKKESFKIVFCGIPAEMADELNADILIPREVSISGKFKAEAIRNFLQEDFSFLICYFSEKNKIGSLLAAEANANVKIGNSPDEYEIYDVEVQTKGIDVFQEEVLKYIEILKKNN
ncbi:DUF6913 domain-containing protein [Christiangramia sediminis]|uniref:Uncharacterized protein n=1 Tax=Christiangramia sediminis TaxID=2881336 RepID=A0A9X1LG29_9FLAO|nr:hypothetical protein [Christiangramia sediminis]MCB7479665.1 hypothetical protein [Christiangramia sediminis]